MPIINSQTYKFFERCERVPVVLSNGQTKHAELWSVASPLDMSRFRNGIANPHDVRKWIVTLPPSADADATTILWEMLMDAEKQAKTSKANQTTPHSAPHSAPHPGVSRLRRGNKKRKK